ncbi:hypothetical protein FRC11_007757, partial [Ceratobasidium sp. 423]
TLLATLHTGGSSASPSSDSGQSRTGSRVNANWDRDIPLSSRTRGGNQGPSIMGPRGPESDQVQVGKEICIHGLVSSDGVSRISGDPDDVKCFDASGKPHALV